MKMCMRCGAKGTTKLWDLTVYSGPTGGQSPCDLVQQFQLCSDCTDDLLDQMSVVISNETWPEDDDSNLPVTEEWLRSVGFWRGEDHGGDKVMLIDIGHPREDDALCWDIAADRMSIWVGSREILLGGNTRGDVRRLASALGIPLTEQRT